MTMQQFWELTVQQPDNTTVQQYDSYSMAGQQYDSTRVQ